MIKKNCEDFETQTVIFQKIFNKHDSVNFSIPAAEHYIALAFSEMRFKTFILYVFN
jgi:hypothetical protein